MKLMKLKNLTAISTQPIQNFKQEQIKEIMSKQATFKPKINKTSRMIVEKKIEEIGGTVQDIYNKETIRRKKFQNMLEEKNKQIIIIESNSFLILILNKIYLKKKEKLCGYILLQKIFKIFKFNLNKRLANGWGFFI